MKKYLVVVIIITMLLSLNVVSMTAQAEGLTSYVLHDSVKVYSDLSLTAVVATLDAHTEIEVLDAQKVEDEHYYKIAYGDILGYVKSIYVYFSGGETTYDIFVAKAYGKGIGDSIKVYLSDDVKSVVIDEIIDGTTINVAECESDEFYIVIYEDGIGYVTQDSITTGLSYNQRVALAIGIICVVTVILILVITYYRRNAEYFKSKRGK
ncbi:MAG: hypothetical protein J6V83_01375 [Clostridia bacterium]|nr:hypothetical protein [Clostridia bacterium]